jgi:hypothetical protein
MIWPPHSRHLSPIEIDILEEVGRLRPDVKRDAYRKFMGRKAEGKHSENKLARILSRLIEEEYVLWRVGRHGRKYLVLAKKSKSAIKRARARAAQEAQQ